MTLSDIIIHRGNSPINKPTPLQQVTYYANAGFKTIEIDIYAITATTYKFCHPLDASNVDETYSLNDQFLEKLVKQLPDVEWFVDLKCLDLDEVPLELLKYLTDVFGDKGVITGVQREILEFAHRAGQKTAQYFKTDANQQLSYMPDWFMQNDANDKVFEKAKTIVYCPNGEVALGYLRQGYGGVMVDGYKLVTT